MLRIPYGPSITGTSTSDCLVSYPVHSFAGVLPLCRGAVSVFWARRFSNFVLCNKSLSLNYFGRLKAKEVSKIAQPEIPGKKYLKLITKFVANAFLCSQSSSIWRCNTGDKSLRFITGLICTRSVKIFVVSQYIFNLTRTRAWSFLMSKETISAFANLVFKQSTVWTAISILSMLVYLGRDFYHNRQQRM